MTHKLDRYLFLRLLTITVFVLAVLIFIFIVIDFSENSDDFTDKGATFAEIFGQYYLNYIPEMTRLVIPVAIFVACLYLTGQMADRLEIVALKAAGISLYRLLIPYLAFGLLMAGIISYLDGFVIPNSNAQRIEFEKKYLQSKNQNVDSDQIYRQDSENNIYKFQYYSPKDSLARRIQTTKFEGDSVVETADIARMKWMPETKQWRMLNVRRRQYVPNGYVDEHVDTMIVSLSIYPQDLARTSSDIYQLTYPEAQDYIESLQRSGATGISLPKIQFYGRLAYPISIIVVSIIGFSIASVRRKGGKGFYIAAGLTISFLYLAFMKVIEPFGAEGAIEPIIAALLPHTFFFIVGLGLLFSARK
ncbi:LptF/LptG family permease [Aliifodinibius sp. S!AR15-10]|uniref:LptF/LptG family permease n=1 Tax=Aliifodinibius sp. S!AR15-10 TaxID=2950437 RepID=UPI00285C2C91|nr:LptF/LptG family permease [Aliifodinibius sp. S!AR15-10]MDR8390275.1 LptF/LptG family permease [Aliifodinibius sp. S!AR15-10]